MQRLIEGFNNALAATVDLVISAKRWWLNENEGQLQYTAADGWFVSDRPEDVDCSEFGESALPFSLDSMAWLQPSWDVSGDGMLETRAFVYALKDGRYVPGIYSSRMGGEPVICVCDEFPFPTLESAREASRELTWSEHCSTSGPVIRKPVFA